jgi:hypothetical protein
VNSATDNTNTNFRADHPLPFGQALDKDALNRRHFADSICRVLNRIDSKSGLVVSVEGSWGCGKTSLLAMVQELLSVGTPGDAPVFVHFNPWLIGERDALLRQFLTSISTAVEIVDNAGIGKKVAKELKTYSKVFDVLKLVPGVEPWGTMIKGVMDTVGDVTDGIADYKTPDLGERKKSVEHALREYPRRIIVFIDDIDRLFPAEVFEMVRIIKAVGDLPNVGYVLAWDSAYVSEALLKLGVPFAESYLDKVVQVRLPVPALSFSMRAFLMDGLLRELHPDASKEHFPNTENALSMLFHHGLSELVESPRDIVRLQDVLFTIEPGLRGEVLLADIIGLACLMTKAPFVFQLLNRVPQAFVGRLPGRRQEIDERKNVIKKFEAARTTAYEKCSLPIAVQSLVEHIFPLVSDGTKSWRERGSFNDGHLAHPERLLVAMQLALHPENVSLAKVSQFIFNPAKRSFIVDGLNEESCFEFIGCLRDRFKVAGSGVELDFQQLCIEIARLADSKAVSARTRTRNNVFEMNPIGLCVDTLEEVATALDDLEVEQLAEKLISDAAGLTIAARLINLSFGTSRDSEKYRVRAPVEHQVELTSKFARNVELSLADNIFFLMASPGYILMTMARFEAAHCPAIFQSICSIDSLADNFIETYLRGTLDSVKGQQYSLPKDVTGLETFTSLENLKRIADTRLLDANLEYPVKAAWRSVVEGCSIYGIDGSVAEERF